MAEINWGLLDTNAVFKGAENANAMLQGLARIKAGNQLSAGDQAGAINTQNQAGDLAGAAATDDRLAKMDDAKKQKSAQMVHDVATALDNIRQTQGPEHVLPAFDHLVPLFKEYGATDDELGQYRSALQQDPESFLTALSTHAADHLKGYNLNPGQHHFNAQNQDVAAVAPLPPKPEGGGLHNVSPGQTVLGPDGKPVFTAPPKPTDPNGGLDPAAIDTATNMYVTTGQMPAFGMNGAAMRSAVLANAGRKLQALGYSTADIPKFAADYKAKTASLNRLQTLRSQIGSYENTVQQALSLIDQYAPAAMADTGFNTLNRGMNWWKTETGDPDMLSLHNAIESVVNEYAKVISNATGGGVTSDAARNRAESMLNGATSVAGLKAQIAVLQKEMGFRVKSMDTELGSLRTGLSSIVPHLGDHPPGSEDVQAPSPTTGATVSPYGGADTSSMDVAGIIKKAGGVDAAIANAPNDDFRKIITDWVAKNPHAAGGGQHAPGQFVQGKIYKDAAGNRARYNNGQWEPVQ